MTMVGFTAMRAGAVLVLLASALAGVAEAQRTPKGARRPGFCTGGLFTLTAGQVKFHVSLDDTELEPAALVLMRLLDQDGLVVSSRHVQLQPGQSATLEHTGAGLFRVQAETVDLLPLGTRVSDRRKVVGIVEVFDDFRIVIPVDCAEPAGQGKIPG
jgi:hypothetical protein